MTVIDTPCPAQQVVVGLHTRVDIAWGFVGEADSLVNDTEFEEDWTQTTDH